MILVFGGTTEGRNSVKVLDEGERHYYYSTKETLQQVDCLNGTRIYGALDRDEIINFCKKHDIRLIIDAAHPFAAQLHSNIAEASFVLKIPVVRYERRYPELKENWISCEDFEDALEKLKEEKINRLLALTGVQTIHKLKGFWEEHETFFRILRREESLQKAAQAGFPTANLIFYGEESTRDAIMKLSPDAVIIKESGTSGGMDEKIADSFEAGVKVFIVKRPPLPESFITVDGPNGLRREVERIIPEFYSLHTGFTTGSCAAAAAKAAVIGLISGKKSRVVDFMIPSGETMRMPVESMSFNKDYARASVIKDAGDDPDITNGSRIIVEVRYSKNGGIRFIGGAGIGTVTLPGLGLNPGEPAINPVPRKMIENEIRKIYDGGVDVTISLENGEALASKTFNPRVGITGGVSIIGTSGIVRPFSHEAFLQSVKRQFDVALHMKCERIVLNSGGRSESFMNKLYSGLPPQAFIHYGNAIGETLEIAQEKGVGYLTIGLMPGKAVKLAEGNMDTHSHKVTLDKTFLVSLALRCGCSKEGVEAVEKINFGRDLPSVLSGTDKDMFFETVSCLCHDVCKSVFTGDLHVVLLSESGDVLAVCER